MHVSVDTFSGAVFASSHPGETAQHTIKHFLLAFATLGVPKEIKTDNGPAYTSRKLKEFFSDWGIAHKTGIPVNPTGQSIVERTHQTLKRVLNQQNLDTSIKSPVERLCKALYVINFLNCTASEPDPPVFRHFANTTQAKLTEKPPVLVKDPETHQISGPFQLITWDRRYVCVQLPSGPRWYPGKNIKLYLGTANTTKDDKNSPETNTDPPKNQTSSAWRRRHCRIPTTRRTDRPITRQQTKKKAE